MTLLIKQTLQGQWLFCRKRSQVTSNRSEVREGARNPLRKTGNGQHETGRGRWRELHARERSPKKGEMVRGENPQETLACVGGEEDNSSLFLCRGRGWSSHGAENSGDWVVGLGIGGFPESITSRRRPSQRPLRRSQDCLALAPHVSFSHSRKDLHLSLAPGTGQGPHRPCQSPFSPASCPRPHQSRPGSLGSAWSLSALGTLSPWSALLGSSGSRNQSSPLELSYIHCFLTTCHFLLPFLPPWVQNSVGENGEWWGFCLLKSTVSLED